MAIEKSKQTTLLEYTKTILRKVSFDRWLLLKEYAKATKKLNEAEKKELQDWIRREREKSNYFPLAPLR
ncbi:MAG TPA: hypothetical protein DIW27_12400 [Cytophagales bacterium]|nr:hypothetical protein [Cytophagales bacterium]